MFLSNFDDLKLFLLPLDLLLLISFFINITHNFGHFGYFHLVTPTRHRFTLIGIFKLEKKDAFQ